MRIVVHGQQAFGKAVLEALLERGDDVVAVYAPPEGAAARRTRSRRPRWPPGSRSCARRRSATRPCADEFRALRARSPGHGVRHADRAGGVPARPDARHHPVPPVAAAAAPRAQRDQLADHQGRDRDRPHGLLAGRRHRHRRRAAAADARRSRETDTLGSVYFDRLFPMGVEALLEAVDLVAAGTAPRDPAGRGAGHLRGAVRARERAHRLGQAVPAAPRSRPRLRPGAGGLDHLRRPGPAGLRGGAAARPRRRGPRRRDGRGRRRRRRRLQRRLRRRPPARDARAAGRRSQDRAPASGPRRAASAPAPVSSSAVARPSLRRSSSSAARAPRSA